MDLSVLIKRLMESGFGENELARVLEVTNPTVNKLKSGLIKNPSYILGKKIEQMYFSCFGSRRFARGQ